MTLQEKYNWEFQLEGRKLDVKESRALIESGKAERSTFYFAVGSAVWFALESFVVDGTACDRNIGKMVIDAVDAYFYGDWRKSLATPDGKKGQDAWNPFCLWYDEVRQSLPFAAALNDWDAMERIAAYPPKNKLPEAAKAKGETAWGWALISYLRNRPRTEIEEFLKRAEADRAKRPKLLAPVLRALMDKSPLAYTNSLLSYLAYYRQRECRVDLAKIIALDGTTLYHLGTREGMRVELPQDVAEHIIQFAQ